ncbi:hypothetical protein CDD80_4000 [Ophiocordyceps camponoti-rufipedis]|uniref:Cryptic loci regulator 2 C-terminal domain-containing protein n=1 Tax=Ophiocordyceps camponoti-rufipedis TaxID=2004952 RepID=A0A2C5Z1H6_9HYPO|nr:hypothetical protein CDD80_4000 [Ophiocordyceps camponoti-rufipedis]
MADTKDFDVIRVARSDGADTGPGYWPSTAAPAINAAKKTGKDAVAPRTKAQMVRLDEDDPRFIEWRIKLGILLKQELSPHPDEGNPWYVHFPRQYWLYEKSKHLWVSGYPVKAKLFKTPQEFGLHLIWLLSSSMDYLDCCCIHCNVPNLTKASFLAEGTPALLTSAAPLKMLGLPPKVSPVPLPAIPGQAQVKQPVNGPGSSLAQAMSVPRGGVTEGVVVSDPTGHRATSLHFSQLKSDTQQALGHTEPHVPTQTSSLSQAPSHHQLKTETRQAEVRPENQLQGQQEMLPKVKPQSKTDTQQPGQPEPQPGGPTEVRSDARPQQAPTEQRVQETSRPAQAVKWALQAPLLFRAGELVWYQNGNSWRLGVIAGPGVDSFQMIPIGHAAARQQNVTKSAKEMRPFHAFSVPGVMLPDLQNKVFDQVSWQELFLAAGQDRARRNNLILDASKMAASKIDASYSVWCPLAEDANAETVSYYGCFFGAERIEVGDCVRVKPLAGDTSSSADSSVLGLTAIVARKPSPGALLFRGTMYQMSRHHHQHHHHQQQKQAVEASHPAPPPESLPLALRDETEWRQRISPSQPWRWVLVKEDVVLEEQAVKGRFYPPNRLMPILNEEAFTAAVASGNVEGQYPFLNNRMDGSGGYIGVKASRRDILGASVPDDVGIILEPLIREGGTSGG